MCGSYWKIIIDQKINQTATINFLLLKTYMFSQSRNRHKKNAMIGVVIALNNESVKNSSDEKEKYHKISFF